MCLSDDEIPNALLPINKRAGTTRPIKGPATYQGQGCFKKSIIMIITKVSIVNGNIIACAGAILYNISIVCFYGSDLYIYNRL
jgi:hypothetical protein